MKIKIFFTIFLVIAVVLSVNVAQAQSDLESRMELIEASQQLEAERAKEARPAKHQVGVSLSNFSSEGNMLNPGFRLENQLAAPGGRPLKLVSEAYYLREEDEFVGFMSLAFEPHPLGYIGAGAEVTGKANYQVFAGVNLTDNIFAEIKGVNSDQNGSDDVEIYFGTGFMIGF